MAQVNVSAVRVGVAGWSYEDWKGIVYPQPMPRGQHPLAFLCRYIDAMEVNSTFYRPPNPRHCAAWAEKVRENPRFRFTAKLWQRFTHARETWPTEQETAQFVDGLRPLQESGLLGAVLVQFPWSFKRTPGNRLWLARVLETFAQYPLSLEIRHSSWDRPAVYEGLAHRGVAFCNIDQPLFRHSITPSDAVTAPVGYVRLHGRNHEDWFRDAATRDERYDYLYSPEELAPWVEKVQRIKARVDELFVVTNNHYRGQAVVNALELKAALGEQVAGAPETLVAAYPRLQRLR